MVQGFEFEKTQLTSKEIPMATGITKIADIVVPDVFTPYVQQQTEEKSRIIQSGAFVRDGVLDSALAGGGLTFNEPSFKDLDNDTDNIGSDDESTDATPNKIGTATEIQVRMSRNNSWSSMNLAAALAGADPMAAIGSRVSNYWVRRFQAAAIATITGVFADNAAAPTGTEHTLNDMTYDISGVGFVDGVTNFSAEAFIDAATTMGDSQDALGMVFVHSIVYARMQKNNLIDFIPDSEGRVNIPTFLGRQVVVDDGMPRSSGVYESWLFGSGAVRVGMGTPRSSPGTELDRKPAGGNGAGQDVLHNRTEWIIHPVGYKFAVASPASGGPSNASTSGNLAHAASWARVFPERKQIKIARLITREA
jgi:hypothetical protein